MAFAHSFSDTFYGDPYNASKSRRPTNVCDALASKSKKWWNELAREVFNCKGEFLDIDTVLSKIAETDTVGSYSTPVDVWIDEEGFYTVDVYDEK